jgi:hypothetical protein
MKKFIILVALLLLVGAPRAAAQKDVPTAKGRPTDLNAYSLRFWSRDSLQRGQTVSTSTPYGVLTCTSTGRGPRQCSLK